MAEGGRLHARGDGEHGLLLETGVKRARGRSGLRVACGAGQPAAGQRTAEEEARLSMTARLNRA